MVERLGRLSGIGRVVRRRFWVELVDSLLFQGWQRGRQLLYRSVSQAPEEGCRCELTVCNSPKTEYSPVGISGGTRNRSSEGRSRARNSAGDHSLSRWVRPSSCFLEASALICSSLSRLSRVKCFHSGGGGAKAAVTARCWGSAMVEMRDW